MNLVLIRKDTEILHGRISKNLNIKLSKMCLDFDPTYCANQVVIVLVNTPLRILSHLFLFTNVQ